MKRMNLDTRAWLVWVLAAAAVTMAARNPLYSILLLAVSRLVEADQGRPDGALSLRLGWPAAARLALLVLLFSGLFVALFVHSGDTVLFWIPKEIPLVGGPFTLEAFFNGAANGLLLLTLLSFFITFNRVVPADRLARLAPRAFQDLGIVLLVALTYIPETARQVQRIREAQAVRGHRIRGLRDWQPLLIPLLVGGLERAMALAEAMVARGFGATRRTAMARSGVGALAAAMCLTFGGWVVALWWSWPGWLLMALGAMLLAATIWSAGRDVAVTHYRRRPWQMRDTALVLASLAAAAALLVPNGLVDERTMTVNFLNGLHWPPFDAAAGLFLIFFAAPAVVGVIAGDPISSVVRTEGEQ